jgi:hypothetical protein
MNEIEKRGRGRPKKLFLDVDNSRDYMKLYQQNQYNQDPIKCKRMRLTYMHRRKYDIPNEINEKYKENVCCAIQFKEMYDNFGEELFRELFKDLDKMHFPKKT